MITIIASESVIASLINQEFEDMIRSYEWEQEHAQEIEDARYLCNLEKKMREAYEQGDDEKFNSLWDFYSDVYKDVYNVRPHWFLEMCGWYHG